MTTASQPNLGTPGRSGPAGAALILVVDDNTFSRRLLVQLLQAAGFETVEASSGKQAIQLLSATPNIRLMTLDLEMPNMNGFQVLEELQTTAKRDASAASDKTPVPVILVTANDTLANRQRGFELGATDFVKKDEVQDQLVLTARLLLTPASAFSDLTVLVAEDSALTRQVILSCVRQLGVKTLDAAHGADALELLRKNPQVVDLVLTDMHMPQMNGDELCHRIRHELGLKELPIILISGTSEPETKIRLFHTGATDYLEKPFIKEELIARLTVYLKRQQLDRNLRANLARLKELDKLKDEFLAVCSHDLRSPLTGILGFTDILINDTTLTPAQHNMLNQVLSSGRYLLELINDILDLGRAQAQKECMDFELLDPLIILQQCAGNFRPLAEQKHITLALTSTVEAPKLSLSGNRTALARIFTNLISNAIKFTPEQGRVSLTTQLTADQHGLVVSCTDSGVGIPAAMMSKLFSRYSKVSREGTQGERGTGLGLVITRDLIEAHGGQLSVQSTEGHGSTFTVTLPLSGAKPTPPTPGKTTTAASPARKLNILAAEDNVVNLKLLAFLLDAGGHRLQSAKNGREAVELFQKQQVGAAPFDLVLMDIEMPELDGRQATTAIREIERKQAAKPIFIAALTGHTGAREHQALLAAGFDAVLNKPINVGELKTLLHQLGTR